MTDTTDTDLAQAVADHHARQAETPAETAARQTAEARTRAEAAAREAGVPFDRYAHEHHQWRAKLATAGQRVLSAAKIERPFNAPDLVLAELMVGGVWLDGPWRPYLLTTHGARLWLSDAGVVVKDGDVQAQRIAGGRVNSDQLTAYRTLLAAEPTPDCAGSGVALDPTDTDDAKMIDAGAAWCFECEHTVPVVAGTGAIERDDRWPELARHDTRGRTVG